MRVNKINFLVNQMFMLRAKVYLWYFVIAMICFIEFLILKNDINGIIASISGSEIKVKIERKIHIKERTNRYYTQFYHQKSLQQAEIQESLFDVKNEGDSIYIDYSSLNHFYTGISATENLFNSAFYLAVGAAFIIISSGPLKNAQKKYRNAKQSQLN